MKPLVIAAVAALFASAASAQMKVMDGMDMKGGMDMKMDKKDGKKAATHTHHATGVVKSVNADKGIVTIDHQAVASMNWPAMSMGFKAKDKKALQGLKPGQKVEFDFVQQGKDYVITKVK